MAKDYKWFEVWIDPVSPPSCDVLLLMSTVQPERWSAHFTTYGDSEPSATSFDVVEPGTGKIHYSGKTYQDATGWLNEDEYELVTGRMAVGGEPLPLIGRYGVE
ncbi:hypothetical protein D3C80_1605530 [compost metagenome]